MAIPPIGKKTHGKDLNYFNRQTVTVSSYNTEPDIIIPFQTKSGGVIISIEGTGTISMSLNGNTDHSEFTNGGNRQQIYYSNRAMCLLWFRIKSGSGLSIVVEAWA